jgi:nickel-dependent lactate racemase
MKLTLPWGKDTLSFDVPDTWNVIYPDQQKTEKKKSSETAIVKNSLKKPVGAKPISSSKLRGKKILIVVDDNTRPTPAFKFFHLILDALKEGGASLKNVLVVPALGIHTKMTEDEMAEKIGKQNLKKINWENHEAFDESHHHAFGTTSRNTPVKLNKHLADADYIITVGLIEPHLWAGFGGGLKNLLPGIASAETIGHHHEIIAEPPYRFNRVGMLPEENSFRLDLEEIKDMIKGEIFCINVSLNHDHEIEACFCGDPIEAHRKGINYNYETLGRHLDRQVDGIIVNSYPMDINFKQSMKCVGNSLPAVKPGGTIMGFLKADRGLDDIALPEDSKPLWLVKKILRLIGPARVRGFLDKVRKGLSVEEKFLIYYSMQLIRQNELFFYAPTISEEEVKRLGFFIQCPNPEEVIKMGIKKLGKRATVAVFPEGGATFPIVGK